MRRSQLFSSLWIFIAAFALLAIGLISLIISIQQQERIQNITSCSGQILQGRDDCQTQYLVNSNGQQAEFHSSTADPSKSQALEQSQNTAQISCWFVAIFGSPGIILLIIGITEVRSRRSTT